MPAIPLGSLRAWITKRATQPTSYAIIPEWQDDALCLEYDPDLWFPEWPKPNEYGIARRVCALCPVRKECLELALETDSRYGMFGGLTPGERENLKHRKPEPIPA